MTLQRKKSRPLKREDKTYRDDRLFVIATEDTYAPDQYFGLFGKTRIHVKILRTEDGLSGSEHVLKRLDDYVKEYELGEDDELWLMLDTDHGTKADHIASFASACTQAKQKGFHLAHSNPCFDIWLLLHHTDIKPDEKYEKYKDVERRLKDVLGSYNKTRIDPSKFTMKRILAAVERAKKLDASTNDPWPQQPGSYVYRVVEKLLELPNIRK